jgi:hypothetical protein
VVETSFLAARPSWASSASQAWLLHALAQLAFTRRGSNKALRAHDMPNCPVENLAFEATDSEFSLQQSRNIHLIAGKSNYPLFGQNYFHLSLFLACHEFYSNLVMDLRRDKFIVDVGYTTILKYYKT